MTPATDGESGALRIGSARVFPLGLSLGPPLGSRAPNGRDAFEEIAANGVNVIRTGMAEWRLDRLDAQIAAQRRIHEGAAAQGLHCWLALGQTPNLPRRTIAAEGSVNEQLLTQIVTAFREDPALVAYKGIDEPRNPLRGRNFVPAGGLIRAYERLKALDPHHPVVIVQAPRGTISQLRPYRRAFDITGVDVYPVSYPPGVHVGGRTRDIAVVGDLARKMRVAAGGKPFWLTLQIAFSGVIPTKEHPGAVPRFPSLPQERFMAYQAIVGGARGLFFFGGHLTQVMTPDDAARGWNWTFWRRVLRPVVNELASLQPALVAPDADVRVRTRPHDAAIQLVTRRARGALYVIAVRTRGRTSLVEFAGLPRAVRRGEALFEYVQQPLPPPVGGRQVPRPVAVRSGAFRDWFAPHDAHVYRFPL